MAERSLVGSLDRIEAALDRIEIRVQAVQEAGGDADLQGRHQRLQSDVESALARIDALLARAPHEPEPDPQ